MFRGGKLWSAPGKVTVMHDIAAGMDRFLRDSCQYTYALASLITLNSNVLAGTNHTRLDDFYHTRRLLLLVGRNSAYAENWTW